MTRPIAILASPGAQGLEQALGTVLARHELPPVWVRTLGEPDHTPQIAREALATGARRIVAAGGDGTLNAVLHALPHDGQHELGIVPLGTANDFARQLGLVERTVEEALTFALTGSAVPIDLGRCNDRVFANVATIGPPSRITLDTSRALKAAIGATAYLVNGLASLPTLEPFEATLRGDGWHSDGRFYGIYAGNGARAGGGFAICPHACLSDGALDLTWVPERALVDLLPRALVASLEAAPDLDEITEQRQGTWFEIRSDEPLPVSLDGEPYEARELRFDVIPRAVRVVAEPEQSTLFGPS